MRKLKTNSGTFKMRNEEGQIVEVPNELRTDIERYIQEDNMEKIEELLSNIPRMQLGGTNADPNIKLMQQIAEALQQGAQPEEIYKKLIEQGIPDQQAQQMIQSVIQTLQEQQQQQQVQEQPQEEEMQGEQGFIPEYAYGGMMYQDMLDLPKENQYMLYAEDGTEVSPFANADDQMITTTSKHRLENLKDNPFAQIAMGVNSLSSPLSLTQFLPNKGLLGKFKAGIGIAGGLAGAGLGYGKLLAKDTSKTEVFNSKTGEYGLPKDVYAKRSDNYWNDINKNMALVPEYTEPREKEEIDDLEKIYKEEQAKLNEKNPFYQRKMMLPGDKIFPNKRYGEPGYDEYNKQLMGDAYKDWANTILYDNSITNNPVFETNEDRLKRWDKIMPGPVWSYNWDVFKNNESLFDENKNRGIQIEYKKGGDIPKGQYGWFNDTLESIDYINQNPYLRNMRLNNFQPNNNIPIENKNVNSNSIGNMQGLNQTIDETGIGNANLATFIKNYPHTVGKNTNAEGLIGTVDDTGINRLNMAAWLKKKNAEGLDPFNFASYFNREKKDEKVYRGDTPGTYAAINSISGLANANSVLENINTEKEYNERLRMLGNTTSKQAMDINNPYGYYATNIGVGPEMPYGHIAIQDIGTDYNTFKEGGEYYLSDDEIEQFKRMGGQIEIIE